MFFSLYHNLNQFYFLKATISKSVYLCESEGFQRIITLHQEKNSLWPALWVFFYPNHVYHAHNGFHSLIPSLTYLLTSTWVFSIGNANFSHFLDDGCLSEHHWWKSFIHISVHIPSFLSTQPQCNFLPHITVTVHSDLKQRDFPFCICFFFITLDV